MLELPLFKKRGKRKRRRPREPAPRPTLEERLRERLEEARVDFMEARANLNALLQDLTAELNSSLRDYTIRNVLREIQKSPRDFHALSEEQQTAFKLELATLLDSEVPRVTAELRDNPEWFDTETYSLNEKSRVWKSIKSLDPAVNKVMRKYNLGAVNTAGWRWLSDSLTTLAEKDYAFAKKTYVEKKKNVEYMETRVEEESTSSQLSKGVSDLFAPRIEAPDAEPEHD